MRSPLQALRPAHCTRSIPGTLPSLPRLQTFHSRTRCTRGSFSVILPERRTFRQNSLPMSCILFRSTSRRIFRRCTLRIPGLFRSFPPLRQISPPSSCSNPCTQQPTGGKTFPPRTPCKSCRSLQCHSMRLCFPPRNWPYVCRRTIRHGERNGTLRMGCTFCRWCSSRCS